MNRGFLLCLERSGTWCTKAITINCGGMNNGIYKSRKDGITINGH